jgi:hypothetical protein
MADADFQPSRLGRCATTSWLCHPRNPRIIKYHKACLVSFLGATPYTVFVHRGKPSIGHSEGVGAGFAELGE